MFNNFAIPLASATGGDGTPGPTGKSAYQLAVQNGYTGTLVEWLASLKGQDGADGLPGIDGTDGQSVELQKSATAIQWRKEGGAFADLVSLEDIRGPGAVAGPGYIDIGDTRIAWGVADSSGLPVEAFAFPVSFGAVPTVSVSRLTVGEPIGVSGVALNGFNVDRREAYRNAAPFAWTAIGPKSGTVTPAPGFNIAALPVWSAAVRGQRNGKRNARLLCIGDSTTAGYGAKGAAMANNDFSGAFPAVLAGLMTTRGSKANYQAMLGTHAAPNPAQYDTRLSYGASWVPMTAARTPGGPAWQSSGTPTTFNLTPAESWDTVEMYYTRGDPINGTGFIMALNGADVGTYRSFNPTNLPNVSDPIVYQHGTVGSHVLNLRAINTFGTYLLGLVTYRSNVKEVLVLNAGWSGSKASDWLITPEQSHAPLTALYLYNPDLTLINLGINDAVASVTKADYQSQMQTIINTAKASGSDVVLLIPNDCDSAQVGTRLSALSTWITELASLNGLMCIDLRTNLGTYSQAVAAGYMRDGLHPNGTGYTRVAEAIANAIMPVAEVP